MKTKLKLIIAWLVFLSASLLLIVLSFLYSLGQKISKGFIDIYLWADNVIEDDNEKQNKRSLWGDRE
jgi:hypothetical protein